MQSADGTKAKRSRRAPEDRRAQLVDLAADAALERGNLPIALGDLATAAGVSKALVYAYFPTQHDLFNAVLASAFEQMTRAGIVEAAEAALDSAAATCADIYFEHVAAKGPVAHLILRDGYMRGHVSAANRSFRDRIARRLARGAARRLQLRPAEALAVFNLAVTIPEEAGVLVRSGDTRFEVARDLVRQLVQSTLAASSDPGSGGPHAHGSGGMR